LLSLLLGNNPNLTTINIHNSTSLDYATMLTNPSGNCWSNLPALTSICADDFEISALQNYLATCGFNTAGVTIDSSCALATENVVANSFSIAPNPSSGVFTVMFGAATLPLVVTVEVYNVLGQKVLSLDCARDDNNAMIDLTNYPSGVYFVKIKTQNGIMEQSVIKK